MAGPYYRMPSGKLPMIDGKPVFITEAEFLCCCCDECHAPCECPCPTWPPEEWPCGGLLETYTVGPLFTGGLPKYEFKFTLASPVTLTSIGVCTWEATNAYVDVTDTKDEYVDTEGPKKLTLTLNPEANPIPCHWRLVLEGFANRPFVNPSSLSPVGEYEAWIFNSFSGEWERDLGDATVS